MAASGSAAERVGLLLWLLLRLLADFFRSFFDCLLVTDGEPPASAGSLPRAPVAAFDPVELLVDMVKGGAVRLRRNCTRFTYVGFLP